MVRVVLPAPISNSWLHFAYPFTVTFVQFIGTFLLLQLVGYNISETFVDAWVIWAASRGVPAHVASGACGVLNLFGFYEEYSQFSQ
jgi:hypothetical protein